MEAEYTFDNNKLLFYFTADGRIDFRELVKDFAGVFKTRIELRQIGVRDETKIVGGIGTCGRPLCCHTHLSEFIPVSIKMAKEQNLSLNPTKISGVCGRLMCCLKHEEETYEELNRELPSVGDYVTTEDGLKGEVQSVNVLRQLVKVVIEENDEKTIHEYKAEQLQFRKKHGRREKLEISEEELKELEKLEAEEQLESVEDKPAKRENSYARREDQGEQNGGGERREHRRNRNHRRDNRESRDSRENKENSDSYQGEPEQRADKQQNGQTGVNQGENSQSGNHQNNRRGEHRHRNRHNHRNGRREGKPNGDGNQSEG